MWYKHSDIRYRNYFKKKNHHEKEKLSNAIKIKNNLNRSILSYLLIDESKKEELKYKKKN